MATIIRPGHDDYGSILRAFYKAKTSPSADMPAEASCFGRTYMRAEDTEATIEEGQPTPLMFILKGNAATGMGGSYENTSTGPRAASAPAPQAAEVTNKDKRRNIKTEEKEKEPEAEPAKTEDPTPAQTPVEPSE